MRRDVAIEIITPILGLDKTLTPSMIPSRNTPNVANCNAYYGLIQKDYGTTLFATGTGATLGAPTSLIYEANFGANSTLQVFTHTAMCKYSSGADSFVNDGQTYSGTFTDVWSACIHNDALIYTNGIQLIQYKPTYSSTGTDMGGVDTSSYKAVAVVSFAEHLNAYRTTEAGNENRKRVRWTKAGTLGYTGTDWTAGTANFVDLIDMEGSLQTAERLGNNAVVIYAEGSIHLQEWVGGSDVYRFTKMIVNKGVPSRRAVVANQTVHYVLTRDNIYEYSGGRDLKPIGDPIKPEYVASMNNAAMSYAFMDFLPDESELRVYIPTGTSTQPDTCYICKVSENYSWFKDTRHHTSKGIFSRPTGLTIGQLQGNIGVQNWKFGDLSVAAGAITYLNGEVSGRIVKRDKTVYSVSESGTNAPQSFVFDTKDLSSVNDIDPLVRNRYQLTEYMDNQSRWLQVKVEAQGAGSMQLHYSTDEGRNFIEFDDSPFALIPDWYMYVADVDVAAEKFMVRVSNTATNEVVHLRYIKAQLVPGAEVR